MLAEAIILLFFWFLSIILLFMIIKQKPIVSLIISIASAAMVGVSMALFKHAVDEAGRDTSYTSSWISPFFLNTYIVLLVISALSACVAVYFIIRHNKSKRESI